MKKNAYWSVLCVVVFFRVLCVPIRAAEDVWLIDTHNADWTCASDADFEKIKYYQLVNYCWVKSNAEKFFQTQTPDVPLILFAPGYTSTTSDTIEAGMTLVSLYNGKHNARTVFWEWPADRQFLRLSHDIRAKIPVAAASGNYVSKFLRKLQPESQICLIGFSFGNRVICDAVQNSGELDLHIHLILMASATDRFWLTKQGRHADVPRFAEKILILYNPQDRALKFYPSLYGGCYRPESLGRLGLPTSQISEEYRNKIESININSYAGKYHRTVKHLQSPAFRQKMGEYLFFE